MLSEKPSIFVCGPQTSTLPPQEYFVQLRENLRNSPTLETLDSAVAELPHIWITLVKEHPPLGEIPGAGLLKDLTGWITGASDSLGKSKPLLSNMHLGPLTVVLQVLEYLSYLARSKVDHAEVMRSVAVGGFQGLCTGFLTASALSCSKDTAAIGKHAAVALRLAVCIGAMVDLDNQRGMDPAKMISVTASWTSTDRSRVVAVLAGYKEAYLSVNLDKHSMTITTPETDIPTLFHELGRIGVQINSIGCKGRYHHLQHSAAVANSNKVLAASPELFHFPNSHALVPLRSSDSGAVVSPGEPLHETALRCLLMEMADWHATMSTAVATILHSAPADVPLILGLGLVDCVPQSLVDSPRSVAVYRKALDLPETHWKIEGQQSSRSGVCRAHPVPVVV